MLRRHRPKSLARCGRRRSSTPPMSGSPSWTVRNGVLLFLLMMTLPSVAAYMPVLLTDVYLEAAGGVLVRVLQRGMLAYATRRVAVMAKATATMAAAASKEGQQVDDSEEATVAIRVWAGAGSVPHRSVRPSDVLLGCLRVKLSAIASTGTDPSLHQHFFLDVSVEIETPPLMTHPGGGGGPLLSRDFLRIRLHHSDENDHGENKNNAGQHYLWGAVLGESLPGSKACWPLGLWDSSRRLSEHVTLARRGLISDALERFARWEAGLDPFFRDDEALPNGMANDEEKGSFKPLLGLPSPNDASLSDCLAPDEKEDGPGGLAAFWLNPNDASCEKTTHSIGNIRICSRSGSSLDWDC